MKTIEELIEENKQLKKELENEIREKEKQIDMTDSLLEKYNMGVREISDLEEEIEQLREDLNLSEQVLNIASDMFSIGETKRKIATKLSREIYLVIEN